VLRAETVDGNYIRINKKTLPKDAVKFTDSNPKPSNYYKVVTYNTDGDSAYSHPLQGLLPDIKPPKTPIGLKGKVDTSGHVILTWKPNTEKDL
ncbi:hypothetical protein ACS2QB_28630, partial [Bacillus cereus group sp. Bce039]|uniref:hypothetical protein n=1 Tax=Bacillus cereus group sp. Bce039 TaxID=3445230 RepID=UPI003F1FF4C1